jgi:hypothetical protein
MFNASRIVSMTPFHLVAHALRPPPIFQIGFNKCGTTSLHRFLSESGIASAHWGGGQLARRIMARIRAGQDPVRDYPTTIAFTDMIALERHALLEPYKRFGYLHRWYPNALFILNTRDREAWIASRCAHELSGSRLVSQYSKCLRIPEAEVPDFWRAEWHTHHTRARAFFAGSPNFLEFNIEQDDPCVLRSFLARQYERCAETPFDIHNQSGKRAAQSLRKR